MSQTDKKIRKISYSRSPKTRLHRSISISSLFKDIKSYKPLTKKQFNELILTYYSSDYDDEDKEKAFQKLCKHNMLLVVSIAKSYCSMHDNLDDLIQEGNIGLMKAIEMYDIRKGTPFSNYASYWIRRYINMFKSDKTPMIVQTNRSKTSSVITKIKNELYQHLERNPTPNEILEEYNYKFPNKKINDKNDFCDVEYVFIDELENISNSNDEKLFTNEFYLYNQESSSQNDYVNIIEEENNHNLVKQFIKCLNEKEKKVIKLMFGLDNGIESSIGVISKEMGYTEARIRQIYNEAINKMKIYKEQQAITYSK